MIDAIILAGGFGTRLAKIVPNLPKALAPIRGVAFLDLMLHQLARTEIVTKAVLALGHRSEAVQNHFQNHQPPLPLAFSVETEPLGTGGALLQALQKTNSETVLVLRSGKKSYALLRFVG